MGLPLIIAFARSALAMADRGRRLGGPRRRRLAAAAGGDDRLGVGIDYALLILNRFRLERGAGRDVREATLIAIDTSGRAVLFAGIVVVIAMLGMMLLGISLPLRPGDRRRARGAAAR